VWGAFAPRELRATTPEHSLIIRPQRLIIATGAYEIAIPFPGWDLPGVMTTGAAQTLLRGSLVTPGHRVLVAGNGPLNLQVARELADAGAKIVAVAEAAPPPNLHNLGRMAFASPALVWSGMKHVLRLRKHGLEVAYRHALTRVEARSPRELAATTSEIDRDGNPIAGTRTTHLVDAVCTGYGFQSQTEIARALGCAHSYDTRRGTLTVNRDAECRTSVREVFVVGDAGGLGGAHIAMAQGTLAGAAVARDLGKPLSATGEQRTRAAQARLARHTKFQAALWSMYAAPLLQRGQLAAPDTQVCRCEGLTKRDLLTYAEQGMSLAAIKRRSRAAMGGCQGRYCTPVIMEILRLATKTSIGEGDIYAPRPPFRPTPAAQIAALDLQQEG
jgi:NADPH-dependent 2,4-dienoyl-CoA reductase/sulfur reductase-like enzyme